MSTDTEVIIIGAGPAGISSAIKLEEIGVDYLLFDRDLKPSEEKPCAGFIPISTINRLSIPTVSDQHMIDEVRLQFSGKELSTVKFDQPLGVNVSRGALGQTMLSMTSSTDNHHLGTKITKVETNDELCRVTSRENDKESSFTAKIIIDASGANPVSQRFIPLRPRISNSGMGYGLQYHIELEEELSNSNTFLYGSQYSPSGYTWIFPRGKTAVFGTGGLVKRVRENKRKTHEYLDKILREVEPFCSELSNGTIVKKDSALMPLCGIVTPSYGKRIMLAGDAAGHCSPISGEGIHYSMVGGLIAAQVAASCVLKKDFSDKILATYEKKWIKEIGSDLKWGHWLQTRLMKPGSKSTDKSSGTSGWSSSGFIDSEKSLRIIAGMLMGEKSVRSSILSIAPGYLKSKISRKTDF
ncbi:MAG: NAD(P)/FAD-dependent oxidoreductase [Candidatus Thorarchaeota archaeon]|nr:MAG: NAD(P)/FAD-dependent oxidoreductase [Candidatus Thorarchaeota archaeon]